MAQGSSSLFSIHRHFPVLILRRNIPSAGVSRPHIPARPTCLRPSLAACSCVPNLLAAAKRTIDFAFDDPDAIEKGTLTAIIGRRKLEINESIIEEKSIMKSASKLAFIITEKQYTRGLDGSIPVLVKSGDWMYTAEEIDDLFLGDAEVWRRPTSGKADPLGGDFPMVTKEGHHILDVIFTSPILDLAKVGENLDQIDGVVDHGVIAGIPIPDQSCIIQPKKQLKKDPGLLSNGCHLLLDLFECP